MREDTARMLILLKQKNYDIGQVAVQLDMMKYILDTDELDQDQRDRLSRSETEMEAEGK